MSDNHKQNRTKLQLITVLVAGLHARRTCRILCQPLWRLLDYFTVCVHNRNHR